jgi:sodium-dependent dicarboxylate transporter 2/3/5
MLFFGTRPKFLLLGTMVATWFLSMWISNTATTMMMIPNVISIMNQIENQPGAREDPATALRMSGGFFLGLAYAASIGGVATKIGTPPNLVLMRVYQLIFPDAPEITFGAWYALGFPVSVVMLLFVWGLIVFKDMPPASNTSMQIPPAVLRKKYTDLGGMNVEERVIAVCFFLAASLWFFRVGFGGMPGWSKYFPNPGFLKDGTVAIGVSFLLFCLPAYDPSEMPTDVETGEIPSGRKWNSKMLRWHDAKKLPWDMVLLFGGGFALAKGFTISGLSVYLGDQLVGLGELPLFLIVLLLSLFVCFLTEITSNTATSNVLLPIVGALSVAIKVHPLVLMIPAAMCCSFAFMLPMATPPNLLAFATGKITMVDMCKHGIVINLFAVIIVTLNTFSIVPAVLGFDVASMPAWALVDSAKTVSPTHLSSPITLF